jgi:hypothetical protein
VFPADWLDQYAYARNRVVEEPVCDVASITIDAACLPASQPLWKVRWINIFVWAWES